MFQRQSYTKSLTLPSSIFNIESLTQLDLSYCNIVDGIVPNDLSGLSSLQKLDLSGNEFVTLLDGFLCNLLNLKYLYLNSCPKLQFLPQPSPGLNIMDAGECGSLRTLSDQKLLHLFASMEQDGQHAEGLRRITNFSMTIPGSEIPSWFENQDHLPLNGKHVASVMIDIPEGRTCEHEKEVKSCHLWIVFWKIKEENKDDLSRSYSQIHLKFTDWEKTPSTFVDVESIKCGWRFISKGDLERLEDGENTISSEEDEHEQCSLLQSKTSQTIIKECKTSSSCSENEVKLDDS